MRLVPGWTPPADPTHRIGRRRQVGALAPLASLPGGHWEVGLGHLEVVGIWVGGSVLSVYGRAEQDVLATSG